MLMFDNNIEIHSALRLVPSGNNISILKTQFSFNEAQSDWHILVNRFELIPTGFTALFASSTAFLLHHTPGILPDIYCKTWPWTCDCHSLSPRRRPPQPKPVSLPLSTLSLSLFLDQTEYKNNLEIEKIQLNIKSVANCGKTRMVNLHKYFQFKEKWSRAIQSYWPTQSTTDFDQSNTNWIKSNWFW